MIQLWVFCVFYFYCLNNQRAENIDELRSRKFIEKHVITNKNK